MQFNAWEYSGCQILWAGIVTKLAARLEEKFGKYKVRLCRHLSQNESSFSDPTLSKSNSLTALSCIKLHGFMSLLLCLLLGSIGGLIYFLIRKGITAVGTQIVGAFSSLFAAVSIISKYNITDFLHYFLKIKSGSYASIILGREITSFRFMCEKGGLKGGGGSKPTKQMHKHTKNIRIPILVGRGGSS